MNQVIEINLNTFSVSRRWDTGQGPLLLAVDSNNKVFVPNRTSQSLSVIDTFISNKTDIPMQCDGGPDKVTLNPSKNEVYVACLFGDIKVIDIVSFAVKQTISTGWMLFNAEVSLDGNKFYVSTVNNSIAVFDTNTFEIVDTINLGGIPYGLDIHPDLGQNLYVTTSIPSLTRVTSQGQQDVNITAWNPTAYGKFIIKETKAAEYFTLLASIDGNGTISADGLTCNGGNCTGSYLAGSNVVITAVPGAGLETRWTGCTSSNGNTCTVFMNYNKNVQVQFVDPSQTFFNLTANIYGTGSGTLIADGLVCNGTVCTGNFLAGTEVSVTPDEDSGSIFSGWTDCDTIEGEVCKVIMNADRTVYAQFDLLAVEYTKVKASSKKLSFGNVKTEEAYTKVVTLTNSGANEMFVSDIAITGLNASAFSQTNTCNSYIQPGGQCQITVNFQSYVSGKLIATMEITVNSLKMPIIKIGLKANVKPPKLKASPSSVSYKSSIGTPMVRTITLQNKGLSDLDSICVRLADDLSGVFSLVSNCGATLLYGQSCTIDVTFTSKTSGEKETANLFISSNDPVKPEAVIRLSGTGK
jgi:hypothetical protein